MDGINRMGVPNADEQPLPGDPAFAAKVKARVEATGVEPHHAVLFEVLAEIEDPGDQVQALLAAAKNGKLVVESGPHGDWTARLAEKLFGPKGPKITRS